MAADGPPMPSNALFSVSGRAALVTGGSRGIGQMIARGLLQAGARVIISSRTADVCEEVAVDLSQFGECTAIPADVSRPEDVETLATAIGERFPDGLDLLVNNAGATWGAPVADFPTHAWGKVISTNVAGVFQLTAAVLPSLRVAASRNGPARVINIGSVDGMRVPRRENYPYSASKAAVHMLTRHLADRLAGEAITVNAIAPGPFESRMTAFLLDDPAARAELEQDVPLGRLGTCDDIVGLTTFLASRAGAYVTGAIIPLDGGMTGCS